MRVSLQYGECDRQLAFALDLVGRRQMFDQLPFLTDGRSESTDAALVLQGGQRHLQIVERRLGDARDEHPGSGCPELHGDVLKREICSEIARVELRQVWTYQVDIKRRERPIQGGVCDDDRGAHTSRGKQNISGFDG